MNSSISERSRGLCPAGFHIPSDCEWMYLEHGQGMSISQQQLSGPGGRANSNDNLGTPGYKLRSAGTGATNASGFSGLSAGYRHTNGTFITRTTGGNWWSSSATASTEASFRALYPGTRGVVRNPVSKNYGFSVRCLKD
jgi:uncharacterized protein (TIGR02145 family)